jgi:hypothetical protein
MSWVRARLRFGSHLALFALAVQLVLSFGHVHLDDLVPASSVAATAVPEAQAPVAPDHDSDGPGHDYCGICALIQLAGTAAASLPPPLAVPALFTRVRHERYFTLAYAVASPHAFQARAPPLA